MKDVNAKTKWAEFDKDEVVWRIKTTGGMTRLRSLLDDVVDEICLFRELRFVAEVFSTLYWLQGSNAQQTVYKDAQRHEVKLRGNGKSLFSLQYRAMKTELKPVNNDDEYK